MRFPLYDYYLDSNLSLEEILKHYIQNFYLRNHGRDKAEKVLYKVTDSKNVKQFFEKTTRDGIVPNYDDFIYIINEITYFIFQSNSTQALAALAAAIAWDRQVNIGSCLKSVYAFRNDTILIFKKLSIYEEMTLEEFESMTNRHI